MPTPPPTRQTDNESPRPRGSGRPNEPPNLHSIWTLARRAAMRVGASEADADDVAQIVTERLWRTWDDSHVRAARGRGPDAWDAYVVVAGRNALRDLVRSRRRRQAREQGVAAPEVRPPPAARPGVQRSPLVSPSAIDEYLARLEIAAAIKELPGRQRYVAWRIFIDGWSLERVGNELGLSPRTIREDKSKALAGIRAALRDQQS